MSRANKGANVIPTGGGNVPRLYPDLTAEVLMHSGETGGTFLHTSRTDPARMNIANVTADLQEQYTGE